MSSRSDGSRPQQLGRRRLLVALDALAEATSDRVLGVVRLLIDTVAEPPAAARGVGHGLDSFAESADATLLRPARTTADPLVEAVLDLLRSRRMFWLSFHVPGYVCARALRSGLVIAPTWILDGRLTGD